MPLIKETKPSFIVCEIFICLQFYISQIHQVFKNNLLYCAYLPSQLKKLVKNIKPITLRSIGRKDSHPYKGVMNMITL